MTWLGNDAALLADLPEAVTAAFGAAARPAVIVGGGALKIDGLQAATLTLVETLGLIRDAASTGSEQGWNGYNVLHMAASRMAGLMLGYAQDGGIAALAGKAPKLLFLLGADEVDFGRFAGATKVYVGHHGDKGAAAADIVLPGAAYAEKSGTWVNLEGRVQRGERAVFAPGDARDDWSIFRALSETIGQRLPFDTIDGLRLAMTAEVPMLGIQGLAEYRWGVPTLPAVPVSGSFGLPISDFYLTNAICRASPTMQRCSDEIIHGHAYAEAAE